MLQEAHLFHNHLVVTSHETRSGIQTQSPTPQKSFLECQEVQSWKPRSPVDPGPSMSKNARAMAWRGKKAEGSGTGVWTRETDSHVCYLGYLPFMSRIRAWSQLHGLVLYSQSENKAKPAINSLGSKHQFPCVSPASWVFYLRPCNILFQLNFLPFSLNTILKHCLNICKY